MVKSLKIKTMEVQSSPFSIAVREVPRTKKINEIIARPINTIKRSLINPHINCLVNTELVALNEMKYLLSVLIF